MIVVCVHCGSDPKGTLNPALLRRAKQSRRANKNNVNYGPERPKREAPTNAEPALKTEPIHGNHQIFVSMFFVLMSASVCFWKVTRRRQESADRPNWAS